MQNNKEREDEYHNEEIEYMQKQVRFVENKFPAHRGVLFVIETNKLLRKEIDKLKRELRTANTALKNMHAERLAITQQLDKLRRFKDEIYNTSDRNTIDIIKELSDLRGHVNLQQQTRRKELNKLEAIIARLRADYSDVINRYCLLQQAVKNKTPEK